MKNNKRVYILITVLILFGLNLGFMDWDSILSSRNLTLFLNMILCVIIVSNQFKKFKVEKTQKH